MRTQTHPLSVLRPAAAQILAQNLAGWEWALFGGVWGGPLQGTKLGVECYYDNRECRLCSVETFIMLPIAGTALCIVNCLCGIRGKGFAPRSCATLWCRRCHLRPAVQQHPCRAAASMWRPGLHCTRSPPCAPSCPPCWPPRLPPCRCWRHCTTTAACSCTYTALGISHRMPSPIHLQRRGGAPARRATPVMPTSWASAYSRRFPSWAAARLSRRSGASKAPPTAPFTLIRRPAQVGEGQPLGGRVAGRNGAVAWRACRGTAHCLSAPAVLQCTGWV